jgi:PAS domain S-box-containing protein
MKAEKIFKEKLRARIKNFKHTRTIAPSLAVVLVMVVGLTMFNLIHSAIHADQTISEAIFHTVAFCAIMAFFTSMFILKRIFIGQDMLTAEIAERRGIQAELEILLESITQAKEELTREIAEREKAECELQTQIDFAEGIIQAAQAIILVLDIEGKIVRFNPFTEKLTGYQLGEVRGKDWFSTFLPVHYQPIIQEKFSEVIENFQIDKVVNPILSKAGKELKVEWFNRVLRNKNEEIIGVLAVGHDITQQLIHEQELKDSSDKLKFFAYSIAHDLKSPAIGLHGITNLLQRRYEEELDADGQRFCDQIVKTSEKIVALVDKINLFIETKESPLELETVRLHEILKAIKEEFSPRLSVRQIAWIEPEDDQEIIVDRISIIRVMRNMVDNSLKYGGDELTEIRTVYHRSSEHHIIGVCDNGRGIDNESGEKLFETFYRKNQASKIAAGAGLGLSIVKEMAERHGGRAWVEPGAEQCVKFYVSISAKL